MDFVVLFGWRRGFMSGLFHIAKGVFKLLVLLPPLPECGAQFKVGLAIKPRGPCLLRQAHHQPNCIPSPWLGCCCFVCLCTCVCLGDCLPHVCWYSQRSEKVVESMELNLQVVLSCLAWVLRTEPGSSGRALLTMEPSPAQWLDFE